MGKRLPATCALAGLICFVAPHATASGRIGYLPGLGPVSLHFELPLNESAAYQLPALPMNNESLLQPPFPQANAAASGSSTAPGVDAPFPFPQVSLWGTILNWAALFDFTRPADPSASVADQNLSQAFIEFFKPNAWRRGGGTNSSGVSVFVPVPFTPPAVQITPSSRATYRTE